MAGLKHNTHGHTKVADCGCRVCLVPGMNASAKGKPDEAHMRALQRFHAYIHKLEAKRRAAEKKRPAGDGLIEGPNGKRISTKQLRREYERKLPRNNNVVGLELAPFLVNTEPRKSIDGKTFRTHEIPKSKFVGPRKRIRAGYRPRRRRVTAEAA